MLYFRKTTGAVIEAVQWNDSAEAHSAVKNMNIIVEAGYAWTETVQCCRVQLIEGFYIFTENCIVRSWKPEFFLSYYAPITKARLRLIRETLPFIRAELSKKIHKGDDWVKESLDTLIDWMEEEDQEFHHEISLAKELDFDAATNEATHGIICRMMLIDKLQTMKTEKKLEEMWKSKGRNK